MARALISACIASLMLGVLGAGNVARAESFLTFESGHVRPLCLSPSGALLFAVNTPDNRVEVFEAREGRLRRRGEAVVGLEPVAVAARSDSELFVTNHLSDSVSVVDVSDPDQPFVKSTWLVGDEPRDIVVAGSRREKIFIATAARGQNRPRGALLTGGRPGAADVWVFDAEHLQAPPKIVNLFCDSARALAVSQDGRRVYAAAFLSGNRTTVVPALASEPGTASTPRVGTVVRSDGEKWLDDAGRDWASRVPVRLPDLDVFTIDAASETPRVIDQASGVGTVIFNLAVNPRDGRVYASNLDSRNLVKLEPELRGHVVDNRVTILDAGSVRAVSLNPEINHELHEGTQEELETSLALPVGMEFTRDGSRLYVAAMGSGIVGVLDPAGRVVRRLQVGGSPTGLTLDEASRRLYVMERFVHTILVLDLDTEELLEAVPLRYTPEPERVRRGRQYLYDARSSAHGDAACGSCHIFGDTDGLAWDLGDPAVPISESPLPPAPGVSQAALVPYHPLKGPMTTQSLRGLAGTGAMHWRGDRNGGRGAPSDSRAAFFSFRASFQTLLGRNTEISVDDMEKLRDFALSIRFPPNPIAPLDGSMTPEAAAGMQLFLSDGNRKRAGGDGQPCATCHTLPEGTSGLAAVRSGQTFKVPHLRALFQKAGVAGHAHASTQSASPALPEPSPTAFSADQVRGFGFTHDGSALTLADFLLRPRGDFVFPDEPGHPASQKARELEAFLLELSTGLAPAVGQQVTLTRSTLEESLPRFELLASRAAAGDGDLVIHGLHGGEARGWLLTSRRDGKPIYRSDRARDQFSFAELCRGVAEEGSALTATLVPPGCGRRIGIDRDEDGVLDLDEVETGFDPADGESHAPEDRARGFPGDCSGDGRLDYFDVWIASRSAFEIGFPVPCGEACDLSQDGEVDVQDLAWILPLLLGSSAPWEAARTHEIGQVGCSGSCPPFN